MSQFRNSSTLKGGTINPNLIFNPAPHTINTTVNMDADSPQNQLNTMLSHSPDFEEMDDLPKSSLGTSPLDSSPAGTTYSLGDSAENAYDGSVFPPTSTSAPIAMKQMSYRNASFQMTPDSGLAMTFPLSHPGHPTGEWLVDNSNMYNPSSLRNPIMDRRFLSMAVEDRMGMNPNLNASNALLQKKQRRRESHNAVERRRRDHINERISELGTLIPDFENEEVNSTQKANKGQILKKTVDYVRYLKQTVMELTEKNKTLEVEISMLKSSSETQSPSQDFMFGEGDVMDDSK